MARRRVETTEAKPSAEERTGSLFPEAGQVTSAPPPPGAPLGTLTSEQREQDIKKVQDDAVSRANARKELEKRAESDETGAITQKELDDERAAIQAEGSIHPAIAGMEASRARMNEQMAAVDKGALGTGFFGKPVDIKQGFKEPETSPAHLGFTTPSGPSLLGDEGDEVHATKGEEMYGKPGQFSTYRVGPFSGSTKVRPGETRAQARRRLMDELHAFADEEREIAKKKFLAHFPNAFS